MLYTYVVSWLTGVHAVYMYVIIAYAAMIIYICILYILDARPSNQSFHRLTMGYRMEYSQTRNSKPKLCIAMGGYKPENMGIFHGTCMMKSYRDTRSAAATLKKGAAYDDEVWLSGVFLYINMWKAMVAFANNGIFY